MGNRQSLGYTSALLLLLLLLLLKSRAIENYLICPSSNLSEYLFLTILPFTNPSDSAIVKREEYNQDKFET